MSLFKRILAGNYGDGTIGLKTSLPGFDVSVRSDDQNTERRSFNSEWVDVCRVAFVGFATVPAVQRRTRVGVPGGATSLSQWVVNQEIIVPTGLSYMPVWEERIYDIGSKRFYDDKIAASFFYTQLGTPSSPTFVPNEITYSGARGFFYGLGGTRSNAFKFRPYQISPSSDGELSNSEISDANPYVISQTSNVNTSTNSSIPPFPPYPAYPPDPNPLPGTMYVVYFNKLGDIS